MACRPLTPSRGKSRHSWGLLRPGERLGILLSQGHTAPLPDRRDTPRVWGPKGQEGRREGPLQVPAWVSPCGYTYLTRHPPGLGHSQTPYSSRGPLSLPAGPPQRGETSKWHLLGAPALLTPQDTPRSPNSSRSIFVITVIHGMRLGKETYKGLVRKSNTDSFPPLSCRQGAISAPGSDLPSLPAVLLPQALESLTPHPSPVLVLAPHHLCDPDRDAQLAVCPLSSLLSQEDLGRPQAAPATPLHPSLPTLSVFRIVGPPWLDSGHFPAGPLTVF